MELRWRKFDPSDYPIVSEWFIKHGWPQAPDLTILPSTGIIVEDALGERLGVAFLYLSNSSLGFLDWIATNPKIGRKGLEVLCFLIEVVKVAAVGAGVQKILHLSKPKYARGFEKKFGFKKTEDLSVLIWG